MNIRSKLNYQLYQISLAPTSNWNVNVGGDFDEFTIWNGVLNVNQLQQLLSVGVKPEVKLSVSLKGAAVTISWPTDTVGFALEGAESLIAGTWTPINGVQNNSVTVNADGRTKFYRLRKQ